MLSKLPKNLAPKFIQSAQTPYRIKEIIDNVLNNPVKIPNYLGFDNPIIEIQKQISPFNNNKHIAEYQNVDISSINRYFKNYQKAKAHWQNTPYDKRRDIFLKAADLIENKYYNEILAYTIVGQNKNIYEAEIDAVCELVDFLRFNVGKKK